MSSPSSSMTANLSMYSSIYPKAFMNVQLGHSICTSLKQNDLHNINKIFCNEQFHN
ncbi:hypothetical protein DERF_000001 [Dermatophagoides farinae]|uniref:Uncharacterized protein n=1 Tax=Dermatophagoides farinae TaxID=6954 RepID=A0A922L9S4_DERFA|nr:hypothetical protein DERF_000001 [Dermatophagoides farinae]